MSWNEEGKSSAKDEDIWKRRREPDPPDLDEFLIKFFKKLRQTLGVTQKSPLQPNSGRAAFSILLLSILLIVWGLMGITIVHPAESAVVLRLGGYLETLTAGPHWVPKLIDSVSVVDTGQVSSFDYKAEMLTRDENIVSVAATVQYRVGDAKAYLYAVVSPRKSLQQAMASALRQVVGHTRLDDILTKGRAEIRQQVMEQLNKILDLYGAGLLVTDVTLQPAKAPDAVKEAFDDAIKAQEDETRLKNQARAYANEVVPIAEGRAARFRKESVAYKTKMILRAEGETSRFLALLPEYLRAPKVTRERLYLQTIEEILAFAPKVVMDTKGSSLAYLPLEKLLGKRFSSKTHIENLGKEDFSAPILSPSASKQLEVGDRVNRASYVRGKTS